MKALLQIAWLWRCRAFWLVAGALISIAALATAVWMMTLSGALIAAAGVLTGAAALRVLGPARVVLRYAERLVSHDAMFRAIADLRVWFFRGLAHSSAGGLGFRRAGDVLSRLVNDIEALDGVYLRVALPLAGAVFLVPVLFWQIGKASLPLAFVVVALFAFAAFWLPWSAATLTLGAGERLAAAASALRVTVHDTLAGLREVRAFGAEGRQLATIQAREAALLAAQHDLATRAARAGALAFLCGQAALLALFAAIGLDPAIAAAAFLAVAAFEAVGGLPRAGVAAGHAAAAARRVLEAANGPPMLPDPDQPAAPPRGNALRFEGVHFRWQDDRAEVFSGLTLDIPSGNRIALLGPSGIGKSTLAALALKVAAPQSGRILLGGTDLATLDAAVVRARIGWLAQSTHLFADTIRANLLLARPDADDDALWAALAAARIADTVRALPEGLDTWVGEAGSGFSGGQGRRLVLARTLLSQAPILILDEPCAGLDAETERAFFTTLNESAAGRTIILIAHRLTGAERLDRIWRLSDGRASAAAG